MLAVDVNVLVNAHRREADDHRAYRAWLEQARRAEEPLGLVDTVLAGFLRIVTHPRIFDEPTDIAEALDFVEALRASPASVRLAPTERHWPIFARLCADLRLRGNALPDAYLAAVAIEHGARWITADRSFARFPGLSWGHPLDAGT